jgi:hypothetical protein
MYTALTFQAIVVHRISKKEYVDVDNSGQRISRQEVSGFSAVPSGMK